MSAAVLAGRAPAAYLGLGQANSSASLHEWFKQPVAISTVGAVYVEGAPTHSRVDLNVAFDGLLLTPRSHAAVSLLPRID